MQTLWQQGTPLHPTFVPINRSLQADWFLLPFELQLQRAHARTLEAAGILTPIERAAIADALSYIERQFAGGPCPESAAEDLHTWIEATLVERIGEAGKKIHTARSRNDQVATLLKMYVIWAGDQLGEGLCALAGSLCKRAKDWSDLVFPLQTHAQFAAPGSVGFWALRHACAFERDHAHAKRASAEWRRFCPLGAGAVAGSSIPIDRHIQATDLEFVEPAWNALDATTSRDECLELLAIGVQVALHLQSFATDVLAFAQTPFGWTKYPRAFGTGSSMMPNKTNPDAMELLRGECNAILASHAHAVTLMKGLPSGYNRDLQCIKPTVHTAAEKLCALVAMTSAFVEQLDFDPPKLATALSLGNIDATLRMEEMVLGGMTLRDAHHAVAGTLANEAAAPAAGLAHSAESYRTMGSASPSETRRIADKILESLLP